MHARTALPCDAQSVRAARRFLSAELAAWGIAADVVDTAELLVSELVTNAVLHARSDVDLSVDAAGEGIRVGVTDGNPRGLTRRRHRLDAATGRGLMLVEQLAASWGVEPRTPGKVVWFEVHPGAAEPEPDLSFFLSLEDGAA